MDVIDLFAGAGGSSEGARQAGARIVWAANHWPLAVEVHQRNHPETEHACQDLHQCDWTSVPRADLVLASPSCRGHSQAGSSVGRGRRNKAPTHDSDRATAWAVVSCLEVGRPPIAVVENVVELRSWVLYPAWRQALAALGYTAHEHVVQAADLGVPQERERLFVTLVRGSTPFELHLPRRDRVPARAVMTETDRGWAPWRRLPPAARARVERSRRRHGGEFVAHYVSDDYGHALDEPLPTITTKHQFAWIRGAQRRMFTGREYANAMGFPPSYKLTGYVSHDCKLVGNAVPPPVMRAIVEDVLARG